MRGEDEYVHAPSEDIENQRLFKSASNGGMLFEGFRGKDNQADGGAAAHSGANQQRQPQREMTEFEIQALEDMKRNDEEIDEMLDEAIKKIDRLGMHAQDINVEVNIQAKKLKQVNAHVDKARENLDKRNSEFASLLTQYRSSSNFCKDTGLCLCLIILLGLNIAALKWKGVF